MSTEDESDHRGGHEMPIEKRWLTARETSEYLHLSLKGVYKACSSRKIPSAKISGLGLRVDKRTLDLLLERLAIQPEELRKSVR